MEKQFDLDKPIGTEELKKLEPKDVQVQGIRIDRAPKDETKKKVGEVVVLICNHPDSDKLLEFTQVKHLKGNSLKVVGLWYNMDSEDNIQKGSVLADTMAHFGVATLKDFEGKTLPTTKRDEGTDYLCIKAYN